MAERSTTVMGTTIGRHRIVRLIGGGLVGRVFACVLADNPDGPVVAVKVLRTKYAEIGERLTRDRVKLEKVVSPHVAQIFDIAVYNNVVYVVSELVPDATSVAQLLTKGPLRTVDALEITRGIAIGMQSAWAHGVTHGDLRPANVLLPRGDHRAPKLTDFGLGAPVDGTATVTGSAAYIAPEILVGTPIDPLTDLYALGCVLFEMLVGKTPFVGSDAGMLHAHVNTEPPSLAAALPGAPQGLVDLVDRLLAKDRAKRLKTWTECLDGVERSIRGLGMAAPAKPQVPDIDLDIDDAADVDPGAFGETKTDEIHTSPARDSLKSEDPPPASSSPSAAGMVPVAPPRDDVGVYRSPRKGEAARSGVPEASDEEIEESTRIDAGIAVPSAEDIGLLLEPVAPKK